MTTTIAHVGADHWYLSLVYLAPVLVIALGLAVTSWRDRRADAQVQGTSGAEAEQVVDET